MCLIRVVNETHSSGTKKNKEWQEKLPMVVLKAEEIMYSKANSEVFCFQKFVFVVRSFAALLGVYLNTLCSCLLRLSI